MGLVHQGQKALAGLSEQVQNWTSSMQLPAHVPRRLPHFAPRMGPPGGSLISLDSSLQGAPGPAHAGHKTTGSRQQRNHGAPMASMHAQLQPHAASGAADASRKAELGRATWTLLHMLAAQFPEKPTRQQQRDAKELIGCLTRIYPCADCASHWQQIVKKDPPTVGSREQLQQWMCRTHNSVNRSLGKPTFNCDLAAARWTPLDCSKDGSTINSCDMTVGKKQ